MTTPTAGRKVTFSFNSSAYLSAESQAFQEACVKWFKNKAFTAEQTFTLARSIACIREEGILIRVGSLFKPYDQPTIMLKRRFDVTSFIKNVRRELEAYQALVLRDKPLFSQQDIDYLLFKKLIPSEWFLALYNDGVARRDAYNFVTKRYDPVGLWKTRLKKIRDRLIRQGLPRTTANSVTLHWSDPEGYYRNHIKPTVEKLQAKGIARHSALRVATRWKDPDKWEHDLNDKMKELAKLNVTPNLAMQLVIQYTDPVAAWRKIIIPKARALEELGITSQNARWMAIVWQDPMKQWRRLEPRVKRLMELGLNKTEAIRMVTRYLDPVKKWETELRLIRDDLMKTEKLPQTFATQLCISHKNPVATWKKMKKQYQAYIDEGLGKNKALRILAGHESEGEPTLDAP